MICVLQNSGIVLITQKCVLRSSLFELAIVLM